VSLAALASADLIAGDGFLLEQGGGELVRGHGR
jgi:hypothetical protein